jgi:chloramphenicol-sensitive protein RarD
LTNHRGKGTLLALGAYVLWGFLPIYWKFLKQISAVEILSHRIVWSLVLLSAILLMKRHGSWIRIGLAHSKTRWTYIGTAVILSANWTTYIWAVNNGYIVESSLGYFINPLINVLLGVFFLKEHLRRGQWAALSLAFAGVLYLTVKYGAFPWIALVLAFTFAFYGLIRKTGRFEALEGMSFETAILTLPALGYLLFLGTQGQGAFGRDPISISLLLIGTGLATAVPLLLFNAAARKIPLSTIGVLQYIAPTLQFLLGILVYHETFTPDRWIGFILIWMALLVYSMEGLWYYKKQRGSNQ